jgi:uncharacterized protein YbjT (DUF2867 family)
VGDAETAKAVSERVLEAAPPKDIQKGLTMKIVVIGGTGLIGSKLVPKLSEYGHETVAASPETGVNTLTGKGLAETLEDAQVIVDVSNPPSFEDKAVMDFFTTSTTNLLQYGARAGVGHLVALSVVGTQRLADSGYMRGKIAQETLIKEGKLPYSIVEATQFFEFMESLADLGTQGGQVHLPPVFIQPMAADDVAIAVGRVAVGTPLNGTVEVAGPDKFRLDELIRHHLKVIGDHREVVADADALYFGARLSKDALVPQVDAKLGAIRFDDWLGRSKLQK